MFNKKKLHPYGFEMLDVKELTLFATGANRYCYIHPDNKNLCIKIVREDSITRLRAKRSFIKNIRPNWWFDDNQNEYQAYKQSAIVNDPNIHAHIPKCYGWINTNIGQGLVLDYFTQASGEPCITLETYLKQNGYTAEIKEKLEVMAQYLKDTQLLTKNILPHNVVIAEDGLLKIIDGLGISSPFNIANFFKPARKKYIERRIQRMFLRVNWECGDQKRSWAEIERQEK